MEGGEGDMSGGHDDSEGDMGGGDDDSDSDRVIVTRVCK